MKTAWVKYLLIILILEKIVQHTLVTVAFYFDWSNIRSTVAVSPDVLMVLGVVVAILFILGLWGMLTRKQWAHGLVMGLALFDIIGEFVAQGRIDIVINVSFLAAILILTLSMIYRRQQATRAARNFS